MLVLAVRLCTFCLTFNPLELEDGVDQIRKSFRSQNTISDAVEVRLKTWGKVSAITQHVVGGHGGYASSNK